MTFSRRDMLRQAMVVSAGFAGLHRLVSILEASPSARRQNAFGLGPLIDDPHGVLNLPKGFSYLVISKVGERMDDGLFVPALHDGMGAFPGPGGDTILVRNHEIYHPAQSYLGPFGWTGELLEHVDRSMLYDPGTDGRPCLGGTTTVVYNTTARRVNRHFLSLTGTVMNCAGGPTPWNTWITCEETEQQAGEGRVTNHGYNFEVPASPRMALTPPAPLKAMGRLRHEAVAFDPTTGVVYQSEDQPQGLIYRFIPHRAGELAAGGRLQALAVIEQPSLDTRNWPDELHPAERVNVRLGDVMAVRWIDLEEIDSPDNDLRFRGFAHGAARFARSEGMWFGWRSVFFACTDGGPHRRGQIWRYTPSPAEGRAGEADAPGALELFLQSSDDDLLKNADNMTMAPWGDMVLAEDSAGRDRIVGVTREGQQYLIAENVFNESELAGVTFSPDGTTLFVNIQRPGLTLAITGPWEGMRG